MDHKWNHKWGRKWSRGRGDQAEGATSHRSETAIDQAEERHDAASIGFIGVNLQQRCDRGKESSLESAGVKQKQ